MEQSDSGGMKKGFFPYFQKNLRLKLLFVIILILVISLTGLYFVIAQKQSTLLFNINEMIGTALGQSCKNTNQQLVQMETQVDSLLKEMEKSVSSNFADGTTEILDLAKKNIETGMETLLKSEAGAIITLLNSVAPSLIMAEEYSQLVKYSKAAVQTPEIVYALFFNNEGKPFPGYINLLDDRIKHYLSRNSQRDKFQTILEYSKTDPEVMILERSIDFYGNPLGKTIVCISRASVDKEIQVLTASFEDSMKNNDRKINSVLKHQSSKVIDKIQQGLLDVNKQNTLSTDKTSRILLETTASARDTLKKVIGLVGILFCIVVFVLIGLLLGRVVINPIQKITENLMAATKDEGDLTLRINSTRSDEIGILSNGLDSFTKRLNDIIVNIGEHAQTVTIASNEALSVSKQMTQGAGNLALKANTVAAATEEMSTSLDLVAKTSKKVSSNVYSVADSAHQMKTTLNKISLSCKDARQITKAASSQVDTASQKVSVLGQAALEISKVTEVITEIAEQTNLLALNASIEAARAGRAGKGFAVVASEIKVLARETAQATNDIKDKISGIQDSTKSTVQEVGNVSRVISDINGIVSTIASDIEEQSSVAAEVADNIAQASSGINEVSGNVMQSSVVSSEIAKDITGVTAISVEMDQRSTPMNENAKNLSSLAGDLKAMISIFKVSTDLSETPVPDTTGSKLFPTKDHLAKSYTCP